MTLAGCGTSEDGSTDPEAVPSSGTGTVAADVPSGFSPCDDIPESLLDSLELRQKIPADSDASGGIKWRGCMWAQPDGYAVGITTTNITVEMVEAKDFADTRKLTVAGREAISSRQSDVETKASCTLLVAMLGGGLEFALTNSPTAKDTGHRDACDLVRELAETIVPTVPSHA